MVMLIAAVCVLVCLFTHAEASTFVEPTWTGVRTLTPADGAPISLSYVVDGDYLTIKLSAATEGWIGFGIGEATSGSMIGADIVTVYISEEGTIVEDRHVDWAPFENTGLPDYYPSLDDNPPDWYVLESSEVGGTTTAVLTRKLDTGDNQDRKVVPGTMRIIFAHGDNDFVTYHSSRRGATTINFYEATSPAFAVPADSPNNLSLSNGGFAIPSQRTTYSCKSWDLSSEITSFANRHVTAIELDLDPVSEKYVHHMLLHICPSTDPAWSSASECDSPTGTFCNTIMFGWAVGGDSLVLPDVAGFLTGTAAGDVQHVVLEIHYDNPNLDSGVVDDSGVIIHYTNQGDLRTFAASSVTLGDPLALFSSVPAGEDLAHYEGACPGECTADRLGSQTITVFSSFLHMHSYGRQIYTRKLESEEILNRADFWNFEYQQLTEVNYTIAPGEQLNTHCTFDTRGTGSAVDFGTGSEDEMCMDFLMYYPRVDNFGMCGSGTFSDDVDIAQLPSLLGIPCPIPAILGGCTGSIYVDIAATVCGGTDIEDFVFLPDGFDASAFIAAFLADPNAAASQVVLDQTDYQDGLGYITPLFGQLSSRAPTVSPSPGPPGSPVDSDPNASGSDLALYIGLGAGGAVLSAAIATVILRLRRARQASQLTAKPEL